jgi:hypothetical protein
MFKNDKPGGDIDRAACSGNERTALQQLALEKSLQRRTLYGIIG